METAIILAAGQGTKMAPFSETQPKACLPIANQPLIRLTVQSLLELGIKRIIVVVGYLEEQVHNALHGMAHVEFFHQAKLAGTAAALRDLAQHDQLGDCLVIYGDVLVGAADIARVIATGATGATLLTALVSEFGPEGSRNWLGVAVDEQRITNVVAHSRYGASHRLAGVFDIKAGFWPFIMNTSSYITAVNVGQMPPAEADLAQSMQDALDAGEEIAAVTAQELLVDLDKPWHLLEANQSYMSAASAHLVEDRIPASARISPAAEINGRLVLGENVVIGPRVRINGDLWVGDDTIIDNGAIIGANCCIGRKCRIEHYCLLSNNTVVGDRCIISHCAEVQGLTMERVHLYHYMEVSGIIGRCTDIGAATVCGTLRFDDGLASHNIKGRRETPPLYANCTYIGDYCRTGVNVVFMPGMKMGPYSLAGPGVVVREDIPPRTALMLEQQLQTRPWGPERYGW